ncbi:MAG: hypothetical protein JRC77_04290 [Deltaproteobacteria bacterium]|nr:hypothetical protein [Deltaproteobacteria bacterium]
METDPAVLAQLAVDIAKQNPLPSVLVGLLLLFLVRRKPKNMAVLTLIVLIAGYSVHLISGLTEDASEHRKKGLSKSEKIIEQNR